ncbi:MAG: lipopolysaccharide transport periplasmic protein LptA [Halioglobus sp.]|nr:lipopolysaccharide transport periplasmic protein LptA [Halioglobus sp.]
MFAASAGSLPNDREQPIHISADKALRDEARGVTIYSGSVHMRQGTMEIEADNITFYHASENADQIVAEGAPAKMQQQPEPDKGLVFAEAKTIHYFRREDRVRLQTQARIEQDGALVTGDSIDYFIDKQLVQAQANQNQEGDKVFVVIPPDLSTDVEDEPMSSEEPSEKSSEESSKESREEPSQPPNQPPTESAAEPRDTSGATEGQ